MPALADLSDTYGPVCIGTMVATIFYGISVAQTFFYFSTFSSDPKTVKAYTLILMLIDTTTTIFAMYSTYWYLVLHWGDLNALADVSWGLRLEPTFSYTTIFIGQLFFIHRVHILERKKLLTMSLFILAGASYGTGLGISAPVLVASQWATSILPLSVGLIVSNKVLATATDVAITAALCWSLRQKDIEFSKMRSTVNRLIVFAVNRGALASVLQLSYMIVWLITRNKLTWVSIHVIVSKVYTNSVLAVLNSRACTRSTEESTEYFSTVDFAPAVLGAGNDRTLHNPSSVRSALRFKQTTTLDSEHGILDIKRSGVNGSGMDLAE